MHCPTCDYSLWNLTSRTCPECGTPFLPSQFDFIPAAVKFLCPHCQQEYYGTDKRGQLVPPEFDCVRCHNHIHMDQMVLLPAEGITDAQAVREPMPWLERKHRGRIRGLYLTILRSLVSPRRLINSVREDSSLLQAWWFAVYTNGIYFLASLIWPILFFAIGALLVHGILSGIFRSSVTPDLVEAILAVPVAIILMAGFIAACLGAWMLSAHALLRFTGPTPAGLRGTAHCFCYSSSANVLQAIPLCGIYASFISWLWVAISATLMLTKRQQSKPTRTIIAVFALPVLVMAVSVALILGLFVPFIQQSVAMTSRMQTTAAMVPQQLEARTQSIALALVGEMTREGSWPVHAAVLLDGFIQPGDLVVNGAPLIMRQVGLTGSDLFAFEYAKPEAKAAIIKKAGDNQPKGVIAHRVGDFVFTYHGLSTNFQDHTLWIVVCAPEVAMPTSSGTATGITLGRLGQPPVPLTAPMPSVVVVGYADGTTETITLANFPAKLIEQNALRAKVWLDPLPDPFTVTPAAPAIGFTLSPAPTTSPTDTPTPPPNTPEQRP